jgi:iron(III) transport system substrate-binding protein
MQIFPDHAINSAQKGAPIRWIAMKPAMSATVSTTGVLVNSPHPNAGKLLLDYLCSEEGQQIYRAQHYIPAHPNIAPEEPELTPGKHRAVYVTPKETLDAMPHWFDIYKELFQ